MPDGIRFKAKRKQRFLEVPWSKIFGAAAMIDDNESVLEKACAIALNEVGYVEVTDDS